MSWPKCAVEKKTVAPCGVCTVPRCRWSIQKKRNVVFALGFVSLYKSNLEVPLISPL